MRLWDVVPFFGIALIFVLSAVYLSEKITREPQTDTSNQVLVSKCPAQQIVQEVIVQERVDMPNGWKCGVPKEGESDLLQPSGYWNMDTIQCFKLVTPIWQWCAENKNNHCTEEQKRKPL